MERCAGGVGCWKQEGPREEDQTQTEERPKSRPKDRRRWDIICLCRCVHQLSVCLSFSLCRCLSWLSFAQLNWGNLFFSESVLIYTTNYNIHQLILIIYETAGLLRGISLHPLCPSSFPLSLFFQEERSVFIQSRRLCQPVFSVFSPFLHFNWIWVNSRSFTIPTHQFVVVIKS